MTNLENRKKKKKPENSPIKQVLFFFFFLFVSLPTPPHFKGFFELPCLWKINGFSPCLGTAVLETASSIALPRTVPSHKLVLGKRLKV